MIKKNNELFFSFSFKQKHSLRPKSITSSSRIIHSLLRYSTMYQSMTWTLQYYNFEKLSI